MSNSNVPTQLTYAELHDVTHAITANNEFEAIALIDMLEDVGIPAFKRSGIVHVSSIGKCEVMVPRVLLSQAQAAIATFRQQAIEEGVRDAYTPESRAEQFATPLIDAEMENMFILASMPEDQRIEALAPHVADWLASQTSAPQIARYLAAAGLQREKAETLVADVKTIHSNLLADSLRKMRLRSLVFALLGPMFLCIPIPFNAALCFAMIISGLGMAQHFQKRLNVVLKQ